MSQRIGPEPRELLEAADELLAKPIEALAGRWPRAVAILTRQAIEGLLFDLWRATSPGVEAASSRAQFLVLRGRIEPAVALEAEFAWAALSRACHHHPYELVPTASELGGWLDAADTLDQHVRRRLAARHEDRSGRRPGPQ
jgi:hypothetical protein